MKFEYKIADFAQSSSEEGLNKLGLDGWEVVSAMDIKPFIRYILKRVRPSSDNALTLVG